MTGRLAGKVAVVTGAGRGIGAACAARFAAEGAKVAMLDLEPAGGAGSGPARAIGGVAVFVACDLTAAQDCARAAAAVERDLGPVDVLVNNAGIALSGGLEEIGEAEWDRTFDVNVKGIYLLTRHILPMMRARGVGSIVNMASESAVIGFPMHPAYCASKAAVVQLTRSMAVRYAPDRIRVNALCPGTIDTELYRGFLASLPDPAAVEAEVLAMHPLGLGTVDDIAAAALFLASDEARYMTGAAMAVDGGSTAKGG